jgi:recombinational DNA repair protein (RecF pathway)
VPVIDDDALVLDHHPYRDRHLIVSALTAGHGVVRGVLRSARGGKAPAAGAVQILSKVRLSFFRRPQAELATFQRVDLLASSYPLARDLRRSAAAAVVAELLATFCPLDEPAPRRYRLGAAALDALLAECDPDRVVTYAQLWVLRLSGLMPPLEALEGDPDTDELAFLVACRRVPLAELTLAVPAGAARRLDGMVRAEAERPLRALHFYRSLGECGG